MYKYIAIVACTLVFITSAYAGEDGTLIEGDLRITGTPGVSGLVFPDGSIQYEATVQGPMGPPGLAGANGYIALISTTNESIGANCSNGGTRVQVGLDINRNSVLDTGEVTQTRYVCNGTSAQSPVNVAGTWVGSVYSTVTGTRTATLTLSQHGINGAGDYSTTAGITGVVSATVSNNYINAIIVPMQGGCSGALVATCVVTIPQAGQSTMTFNYRGSTDCGGTESGSGTLTRQ